jgi:TM2 domain-containing membrane protein YozV
LPVISYQFPVFSRLATDNWQLLLNFHSVANRIADGKGNMSHIILRPGEMRNPGIAAVLSFFIPGVGQIYNGKILRGIFWLIITPGIWLGTGGWFGWVCHLISAYTAYSYARRHPYTT